MRPRELVTTAHGLAKAGLHNMTTMLSQVYAPKVRANVLMPGPFLTDISKAWGDPEIVAKAFEKSLLLQRVVLLGFSSGRAHSLRCNKR